MDELGKALAEAVRAGTELAWPALLLYFGAKAAGYLSAGGTVLAVAWLITRVFLQYPTIEARADAERRRVELEACEKKGALERARWDAEYAHKRRMHQGPRAD